MFDTDPASLNKTLAPLNLSVHGHIFLVLMNVVIIFAGLSGNIVVLLASVKYKALDMNKVTILFVEALAVADLLRTLTNNIPMFLTLLDYRWALGPGLCFFTGFFKLVPTLAEILIIAATSFYRSRRLLFPHSKPLRFKSVKLMVALIWLCPTFLVLTMVLLDIPAEFIPLTLQCTAAGGSEHIQTFDTFLFILVTSLITFSTVANLIVLKIIYNNSDIRKEPCWKAILATTAVCWVFVLSYLPVLLLNIVGLIESSFVPPNWTVLFSRYLISLSVVVNPYIYGVTNKKFAFFLKKMFMVEKVPSIPTMDLDQRIGPTRHPRK